MNLFLSLCMGIGLSACCGFRIFIPLLISNIAYLLGFGIPNQGFEFMASWLAFGILFTAAISEILAYYIPFVDNLLDKIALPITIMAGTFITASLIENQDPTIKWILGLILGGGTAGTIQLSTNLIRLGSSTLTGGMGNALFASIENTLSAFISILALFFPVLIACFVILFLLYFIKKKKKLIKA